MKAHNLIPSKSSRSLVCNKHLHILMPMPCGCVPRFATCGCPEDHCGCELEFEFCEHAGDWPADYLAKIAAFLETVDPFNYAALPRPRTPRTQTSRAARLQVYELRDDGGEGLWHPDDVRPDMRKTGEVILTRRNGSVVNGGLGQSEGRAWRTRWGDARRARESGSSFDNIARAYEDCMSVDDLVCASEE